MDFRRLDLNLLIVLDALFDERSVTAVARRLKVSQPSVSFSLQKLRDALGDDLFIRTAAGMAPTPRALSLKGPIRRVLDTIEDEILTSEGFDPARAMGAFTFSMSDVGELVLLPKILARLRQVAPRASVSSVSLPPQVLTSALESGKVDLALGYFPDLPETMGRQVLFEHPFVSLVRADHPLANAPLTLQAFLAADHAVVSAEGRSQEIFEREVARRGLERRVVLRTPHFMSAPLLIATSDLIATVPRAVGVVWVHRAGLCMLEPPIAVPTITLKQYWHRRFHNDPRSIWLRRLIGDLYLDRDPSCDPAFGRLGQTADAATPSA